MTYQQFEHIPAGQFKVGKAGNQIFQAYLGTCLGVALYDKKTRIGGMIHILLPEPPTITNDMNPEKYASSGIPMLVKEMLELGASPENITAAIAGGALVGPVSQQDINLDIGGRSAEIAVTILEAAGIKTIKSETGGFFTCTLELDMATGKTFINPAWEDSVKSDDAFTAPSLDDIFATIEKLRPIPQTALKIIRMFKSGLRDISDITQELSKDQVLSGQTLKLCNSALFAGGTKIDSLKEAVLLLGEDILIKSVVTAAVNTYFNQTKVSGYSLCKGGLFFHAIAVASLAETIALKTKKADEKSAYTAGLLHDIGKVVLDQYVADSSPLFFRNLNKKKQNFFEAEKKLLGITHSEAGAILARKWNFSQGLLDVIQLHHTPELAKQQKALIFTVYLADLLIEKFSAGFDLEKMQTNSFQNALDFLGLTMADLPELVDTIPVFAFNNDAL